MSALVHEKMSSTERWTFQVFPLAVGNKAYKNGMCAIDLSTGKVEPASSEADHFVIGRFAETKDALLAEQQVNVNLGMEIEVEWWATDNITADDVGSLAYVLDDQTVTATAGGPVAGRIWRFDAAKTAAAIQKLDGAGVDGGNGGGIIKDGESGISLIGNCAIGD